MDSKETAEQINSNNKTNSMYYNKMNHMEKTPVTKKEMVEVQNGRIELKPMVKIVRSKSKIISFENKDEWNETEKIGRKQVQNGSDTMTRWPTTVGRSKINENTMPELEIGEKDESMNKILLGDLNEKGNNLFIKLMAKTLYEQVEPQVIKEVLLELVTNHRLKENEKEQMDKFDKKEKKKAQNRMLEYMEKEACEKKWKQENGIELNPSQLDDKMACDELKGFFMYWIEMNLADNDEKKLWTRMATSRQIRKAAITAIIAMKFGCETILNKVKMEKWPKQAIKIGIDVASKTRKTQTEQIDKELIQIGSIVYNAIKGNEETDVIKFGELWNEWKIKFMSGKHKIMEDRMLAKRWQEQRNDFQDASMDKSGRININKEYLTSYLYRQMLLELQEQIRKLYANNREQALITTVDVLKRKARNEFFIESKYDTSSSSQASDSNNSDQYECAWQYGYQENRKNNNDENESVVEIKNELNFDDALNNHIKSGLGSPIPLRRQERIQESPQINSGHNYLLSGKYKSINNKNARTEQWCNKDESNDMNNEMLEQMNDLDIIIDMEGAIKRQLNNICEVMNANNNNKSIRDNSINIEQAIDVLCTARQYYERKLNENDERNKSRLRTIEWMIQVCEKVVLYKMNVVIQQARNCFNNNELSRMVYNSI